MSVKKISFDDGATVEWVDRETLRYSKEGRSVLVWVDFEKGIFSNNKVIKSYSIKSWEDYAGNMINLIDENEKKEIINKIYEYYKIFGRTCRIA